GYPNGLQLKPQFTSSAPSSVRFMTYIQDQLKQIGIDMPIEQVDPTTYVTNIYQNLNQIVAVTYSARPHADLALTNTLYGPSSMGKPTAASNFSHYDGSDALIEAGRRELDRDKQIELYRQIQQDIFDA